MSLAELKHNGNGETVQANYNKFSDHIRRLTPHGIQCSVFCGGANCKYEKPENWKADSLAIQGIYSNCLGIKSVINLQCSNEHSSCGQPLENSGFSYDPNAFMEHDIYYYNFAWKDYGDATLEGLLNMVKVVAFALSEGRVAIHCHAGLGRTGVLIACFLVYSLRVTANEAIRFVRLKRPGSVQTRGQILCVRHFAQFILPQTITYFLRDNVAKDKYMNEFTLHRYLRRQKVVLHGYEERNFKYLPKIVYNICERILKLCTCDEPKNNDNANKSFTRDFLTDKIFKASNCSIASIPSPTSETSYFSSPTIELPTPFSSTTSEDGDLSDTFSEISNLDGEALGEDFLLENKCFQELETQKKFCQDSVEEVLVVQSVDEVVNALLQDFDSFSYDTKRKIRQYENEINSTKLGWMRLSVETNLNILASLLFEWFEGLKTPILQLEHFENIVVMYKQPEECFHKIGLEECYLIEYILLFISKLRPINPTAVQDVLKRIIGSLSKHTINLNSTTVPSGKSFKKIGEGTLSCTLEFFQSMIGLIENHHGQNISSSTLDEKKSCNDFHNPEIGL
ncbi:unnamed protein product [Ceutorhynchus assimilis]|uniref:Tyrosine specific protein phosphatases domain-containing protein n=1 Tax=Ceutorhynchus assimilis TaxID=467358 RepID=A0A9P0GR55_9CUCU|nr:unnamed protein product [Ceutorhynchus assimilis]